MVEPSGPLRGTIRAGGAKNSALKLMVACLLGEGCSVLSNVPRIDDVDTMAEVLRALGSPPRSIGVLVVEQEVDATGDGGVDIGLRWRMLQRLGA